MAEQEILRFGDLTPVRKRVMIVERNGEEVELSGFVDGKRCPATVRAQISSARHEYTLNPTNANWFALVQAHLLAVVVGLENGEADVLAGDVELHKPIFQKLGWWQESEDDDPPLSEAGTSTTDSSSPTSSMSTEPELSSSSTTSE